MIFKELMDIRNYLIHADFRVIRKFSANSGKVEWCLSTDFTLSLILSIILFVR